MPFFTAAEIAEGRADLAGAMETPVVLCTKTSAQTSGGVTETIVEGATVLGRVYTQLVTQPGSAAGTEPWTVLTAEWVELPVTVTLAPDAVVRIGALYYDVVGEALTDDHLALAHDYQIARMTVGPA